MSNETLQLLKEFIDAAGYDVRVNAMSETGYKVTKKKPKPRAQAKESGYTDDFLLLWNKYPKGHCGSKKATYRLYSKRIEQHVLANNDEYLLMVSGVDRYAKYIEATGYSVKSSETFFGRDRHYTNPFEITANLKKQNRLKLPRDNEDMCKFAIANGLQKFGSMDSYDQYRRKLLAEIEQRELSAN